MNRRVRRADAIALLSCFVGTVASLLAVMFHAYSLPTLQLLAVVSIAAYAVTLVRALRGVGRTVELPYLLFVVGLGFWFYVPVGLALLDESPFEFRAALVRADASHAVLALAMINAFGFTAAVAHALPLPRNWAVTVARRFGSATPPSSPRTFVLISSIAVAALLFYVFAAGGLISAIEWVLLSRSDTKPWDPVGYAASSLSFFDMVATSALVAVAAVGIHLALAPGRFRGWNGALLLTAMVAVGWTAIESGTRSIVLQTSVPPVMCALFRISRGSSARRGGRRVTVVVIFLGVLALANAQRQYRTTAELEGVSLEVKDNDFFSQTALAIAVQEKEGKFLHDSAFLHIISGPVPRALWPNKPIMTSMLTFTRYVWGYDVSDKGINTLPSIVGQYYLNWGWLGVIEIALVLGILLRLLDDASTLAPSGSMVQLATVAASTYFFVSFRLLSFSYFGPMVATLVLIAVAARWRWLYEGRRVRHSSSTSAHSRDNSGVTE